MSYLVQQTRLSRLTIGGTDFTSSLIQWSVSDSSANGSGLLSTTGSVELAQAPGGKELSDYSRNEFKRGETVRLFMRHAGGGSEFTHPRGYLHVISASYSVESESIIVEIGCRIALAEITDEIDQLLSKFNSNSDIELDPARENIQSIASALAAQGKVMYENNQGNLDVVKFFDGDSSYGIAVGDWVSVLGSTNLGAAPLSANAIIPDKINVSYDVPAEPGEEEEEEEDPVKTDPDGNKYTEDIETSYYFFQYPASTWTRTEFTDCLLVDAEGNLSPIACIENGDADEGGVAEAPASGEPESSGCGSTPEAPQSNYEATEGSDFEDPYTKIPVTCNYGWETKSTPTFVTAKQVRTSRSYYKGPAKLLTNRYEEVRGPRVEVNSQFFSDSHAFCTYTYGYACLPSGACPLNGQDQILQSYSTTFYTYDSKGTLLKTVRDTYETVLSAAKEFDWRSGVLNGVAQNFQPSVGFRTDMYRSQRVIERYIQKKNNISETITTTYQSTARARGTGISNGKLDALEGIKTTTRRVSSTVSTYPEQPDSLANPVTPTDTSSTEGLLNPDSEESSSSISIIGGGYGYVEEAGPYVLDLSLPVPVLNEDEEVRADIVGQFLDISKRWIKGDALGMQITEALRSDICSLWKPGQPFRYADPYNNQIVGLRADACSWGVTQEAAVVSISGIWTGFSSGTLSIGDNITGDSQPDMTDPDGTPTPPPGPTGPPTIIDDVIGESVYEKINVHFWTQARLPEFGNDNVLPILPADNEILKETALTVFISGLIVGPGDVLSPTGSGSVAESDGQLVVTDATLIDGNLFAAAP